MKLGLDCFLKKHYKRYIGKRIGLVTNMTGVNHTLTLTIDIFFEHPSIDLVALFAPEHGIRGDAKEGEKVESTIDPVTNLPVYSLYGKTKKPTQDMLDKIDVIVFDLQDIGARYYTFIYTMAYMMEACQKYDKPLIILDRPNPISGFKVEGNLVEETVRSFVGLYPIPNRHGMTIGEMARLYHGEFGLQCDLTVIPMEGWKREQFYDETNLIWVPPSPNTTNIDMAVLYPGTCLIEGTNVSEGRGTTRPFETIGAPYINGYHLAKAFNALQISGVKARPTSFIPTYQKYKNETCSGIQLHVTNRKILNSFAMGVRLIELIAHMYPDEFQFLKHENGKYFFDLLAGTKELRSILLNGKSQEFLEKCLVESQGFIKQREPYLIYN